MSKTDRPTAKAYPLPIRPGANRTNNLNRGRCGERRLYRFKFSCQAILLKEFLEQPASKFFWNLSAWSGAYNRSNLAVKCLFLNRF
jgi:hypothetical protein